MHEEVFIGIHPYVEPGTSYYHFEDQEDFVRQRDVLMREQRPLVLFLDVSQAGATFERWPIKGRDDILTIVTHINNPCPLIFRSRDDMKKGIAVEEESWRWGVRQIETKFSSKSYALWGAELKTHTRDNIPRSSPLMPGFPMPDKLKYENGTEGCVGLSYRKLSSLGMSIKLRRDLCMKADDDFLVSVVFPAYLHELAQD